MRILVTWGSKLGGTEGIARIIGEQLESHGLEVVAMPAGRVTAVDGYDAAIVGGALYANRWHRDVRRLVLRETRALRRIPVWMFSSGPLDDSADREDIAPPTQVAVLMERIGAHGHTTFGGRLEPDVKGFPAAPMAREHSGDWRNPERIRAWADDVARALPTADAGVVVDHPARSPWRLAAHGLVGAVASAAVLLGLLAVTSSGWAAALHLIAAPAIFVAVAVHYFGGRGAREPLPVALAFAALTGALHAGYAIATASAAVVTSLTAFWLPLALILLATWLTGLLMSTMPWPRPDDQKDARADQGRHGRSDAHPVGGV